MTIAKYIHSCLLVEENGKRILIDPGTFSFIEGKVRPEDFTSIDAILVTHEHGDHMAPDAINTILKNNPDAVAYGYGAVADALRKANVARVETLTEGKTEIAGIAVEVIPARHESIPFPVPVNAAYIIGEKLLHPGDS